MAEATVYLRGPGIVARCRTSVPMVLVTIRGRMYVDLRGLAALDRGG